MRHRLSQWKERKCEGSNEQTVMGPFGASALAEGLAEGTNYPEKEEGNLSLSDKIRKEMSLMLNKSIEHTYTTQAADSDSIQHEMITVYSEVELSSQERAFLALGPGFPLMEKLDSDQIERDFLKALTKIR